MEQWYFCVVDVVEVLTESKDPSGYIKTMKRRDPMLAKGWGQIVTPLFVQTPGGRQKMNFSTMKEIFCIIQAIPSPMQSLITMDSAGGEDTEEPRAGY